MTKRLVFFGNERLSSGFDATHAPILRSLIAAGYEIAAVVSHYEAGRSRKARPLEIQAIAEAYNIPVLLPHSPKEIIDQLREFKADAGILVAYGRIIPQSIIDIFPHGIINIHPSLLPKYRGATPIESAILNGDAELGVSVMALAKEMDAGPIYAQDAIAIPADISKNDLTTKALERGASLLETSLPHILDGSLRPTPQDNGKATYCQLIEKSDGIINWQKSATQINRDIRAYLGWPGSRTTLCEKEVTILEAIEPKDEATLTPVSIGDPVVIKDRLIISCGNATFLEIKKLRPAGRSSMTAADFLRGVKR